MLSNKHKRLAIIFGGAIIIVAGWSYAFALIAMLGAWVRELL